MIRNGLPICLILVAAMLAGCGSPNKASIVVRKKNQDLRATVAELQAKNDQLRGDLARRENAAPATTLPTLPQQRLEEMFTVSGLTFGRLTGFDPRDPERTLTVYLTPVDAAGDANKAVGDVTVEAFDLSTSGDVRLGTWTFPAADVKKRWSGLLINGYVLPCPWEGEAPAAGKKITVKVTFSDLLTGRVLTAKKDVG